MLNFRVYKQNLLRLDADMVVADSRNYLTATFDFADEWVSVEPKVATFNKLDKEGCCYSVFIEDSKCIVPWEVLQDKGTLEVSVQAGDLITTNPITINIARSGVENGLQPTETSPSVYSHVVELSKKIEDDWNNCKALLDTYKSDIANENAELDKRAQALDDRLGDINTALATLEQNADITTAKYNKILDIIEQFKSDYADMLDDLDSEKADILAEINSLYTANVNSINSLADSIKADISESSTNIDNKIADGISAVNQAKENAINTINSAPVTKAMLADDIYKPIHNLVTSEIYNNTFAWERATSFNSYNLDAVFGYNKDRNISVTLLEGHKYYICTYSVWNKEYYWGQYSNITFNCNSINNSNYSSGAKKIQLTDANDYFDLAMTGGKNYKAVNYKDKKLISLHNVIAMKQDMTIFTMALYQQGQGLDRTIPLKIYIIDVTDLSESEIAIAANNLADYKQQEVIYLFAEPRMLSVEEKIKSLENAILSLGGNV